MPFETHRLIVFRGSLGPVGGAEDMWQIGLRFTNSAATSSSVVPQQNVDKCRAAFQAFLSDAFNRFSTAVSFEEARGTVINALGTAAGFTTVSPAVGVARGGAGSNLHSWSTSVAVTHDAGGSRRGRFGRVYLPPQSLDIDSSGRFAVGQRDQILAGYKQFVQACQGPTEGGEDYRLVVASSYGTNRPVTLLRVGDVPDTQRRRDNRLSERYGIIDLP